jgi:hypothetical protein
MVADIHNVYVQKLLKKIDSEHEPVYVAVTIEKYALINECFPNVEQKVLIDGGRHYIWVANMERRIEM